MTVTNATPSRETSYKGFNPFERRVVWGLTGLFALRMLGLYFIIPILSPYVAQMPGSTPMLVGLAMGIYGFTQLLFQVPFGIWSDRWGRKPVLTLGLLVFMLGSVICALATNAWILVLGRLVQGMGAMASVAVAMMADFTRDRVRTRAMAMLGVAIGGTFAAGMIIGPWATSKVGIPNLFWMTAILTGLGIVYLWWKIPEPPRLSHHDDAGYSREHLFEVIRNRNLLRLDMATFVLHAVLTAIMTVCPLMLEKFLPQTSFWKVYLPGMSIGIIIMLVGARIAERPGFGKRVALLGQGTMIVALIVLALSSPISVLNQGKSFLGIAFGIGIYIAAFALLEPLLPALLTRLTMQTNRGTAVGIFNMSQFGGAFAGGLIAGAFQQVNVALMFWILGGMALLWFIAALRLEDPKHLDSVSLPMLGASVDERHRIASELLHTRGIEDVAWEKSRERLMIRYDADHIEYDMLGSLTAPYEVVPSDGSLAPDKANV